MAGKSDRKGEEDPGGRAGPASLGKLVSQGAFLLSARLTLGIIFLVGNTHYSHSLSVQPMVIMKGNKQTSPTLQLV